MKTINFKILTILILFLSLLNFSQAQVTGLSLASGSALAGQTISLNLNLSASEVAGLSFYINYNSSILSNPTISSLSPLTLAAKTVESNVSQAGVLRVVIWGQNQNIIQAGNIMTISFQINASAATGQTPVSITNAVATNSAAQPVNISVAGGVVTITEPDPTSYCGDGTCNSNESCSSCPADCGSCPVDPTSYCGDGTCNSNESCSSCPADCGSCPVDPTSYCGDGTCNSSESCSSCPADCGSCPVVTIESGDVVREENDSKVFLIEGNLKRWIETGEVLTQLGYDWSDIKILAQGQLINFTEGPSVNNVSALNPINNPGDLSEGDLIRGPDGIKVYIINEWNRKRHIYNPDIFNMYGHLKWENIISVTEDILNHFKTSALFRANGDERTYYLHETPVGATKRWLINQNVFATYNNSWQDVFIVMKEELAMYQNVNLVRAKGDDKIYLIENNTKRWIKTAEAFNSRGYHWDRVFVVWSAELAEYLEGDNVE